MLGMFHPSVQASPPFMLLLCCHNSYYERFRFCFNYYDKILKNEKLFSKCFQNFIVGSEKTPSERSEDWPLVGGDESDPHNNNRKNVL